VNQKQTNRYKPSRITFIHTVMNAKLGLYAIYTNWTTWGSSVGITCSAVALSRVLRTALVPYGNMETSTPHSTETSRVITMNFAKFGWNSPARGRSAHTWNIHFLWLFFLPACLPYCLLILRTCTGQTDRDNFTHNGSKDAVWREEVPSKLMFFSNLTFLGSFCPKTPNISPTVGKSQPN